MPYTVSGPQKIERTPYEQKVRAVLAVLEQRRSGHWQSQVPEIAADYGVNERTLYRWCKAYLAGTLKDESKNRKRGDAQIALWPNLEDFGHLDGFGWDKPRSRRVRSSDSVDESQLSLFN